MKRYMTSIIVVISLIVISSTGILAADKNQPKTMRKSAIALKISTNKVPVDENILMDLVDMPAYHIEKAREYFLKNGDQEAAANEIRISAVFVRLEAERATTDANKEALLAVAEQLDNMASEIEKGSISSPGEFDYNVLVAGEELANHHNAMAVALFANNETTKAGYELKAATDYTQHSYKWSGKKMEKETNGILGNGQILAGKMINGTNVAPEEANRSIKGVNNEITKLKQNTNRPKAVDRKETQRTSEQKKK
jgi:hypothetical protein